MVAHRADLSTSLAFAARTDAGLRRSHNEDKVATDAARGVALVADGMGGHKGGEVASGLAIETAMGALAAGLDAAGEGAADDAAHAPETLLAREAVARANTIIHETARTQPQYEGMGTTVVAALFYDDRLSIAHVGDARAYRLRGGRLEQLTRDHTLLQELVERGFYTPEEARASLNRNVVTRALGTEDSVAVDVQEEIVLPGDLYLLCSDGLNDMVADEDIRLTIDGIGDNLDRAAESLIAQANEKGGHDNVSVVLIKVLGPFPTRAGWFRRLVDWFQ